MASDSDIRDYLLNRGIDAFKRMSGYKANNGLISDFMELDIRLKASGRKYISFDGCPRCSRRNYLIHENAGFSENEIILLNFSAKDYARGKICPYCEWKQHND